MATADHQPAVPTANNNPSDNLSINTTTVTNRTITASSAIQEYVVKFQNSMNNAQVAKTHYTILCSIVDIYPEAQILDNFGSTMTEFPTLKSYNSYLRHFKLQFVKSDELKKRGAIYLVFHRFCSSVPIGEIRSHASIHARLQQVNTCMTVHQRHEDETQISNLGFYVGVNPSNFPQQMIEERVKSQISAATGRIKKNIPRFHCCYTSPFIVDDNGLRTTTKSYDFQCRQKDAKELVGLLQQTYKDNPVFIFHKLRHKDPISYTNAICSQNSFLANTRVIPIQGIDAKVMFYLENDFLQEDGLHEICPHKDTPTKGCWNIITTVKYFKPLTAILRKNLAGWAMFYTQDHLMDPNLPSIGVAFRSQPFDDQSSDCSFQTYMSNCSTLYTMADYTFGLPPASGTPTPQAWGATDPIPLSVRTPLTPSPSPPTNSASPSTL